MSFGKTAVRYAQITIIVLVLTMICAIVGVVIFIFSILPRPAPPIDPNDHDGIALLRPSDVYIKVRRLGDIDHIGLGRNYHDTDFTEIYSFPKGVESGKGKGAVLYAWDGEKKLIVGMPTNSPNVIVAPKWHRIAIQRIMYSDYFGEQFEGPHVEATLQKVSVRSETGAWAQIDSKAPKKHICKLYVSGNDGKYNSYISVQLGIDKSHNLFFARYDASPLYGSSDLKLTLTGGKVPHSNGVPITLYQTSGVVYYELPIDNNTMRSLDEVLGGRLSVSYSYNFGAKIINYSAVLNDRAQLDDFKKCLTLG